MIVYIVIGYNYHEEPGHNIQLVTSTLSEAENEREKLKQSGCQVVEVYDYTVDWRNPYEI